MATYEELFGGPPGGKKRRGKKRSSTPASTSLNATLGGKGVKRAGKQARRYERAMARRARRANQQRVHRNTRQRTELRALREAVIPTLEQRVAELRDLPIQPAPLIGPDPEIEREHKLFRTERRLDQAVNRAAELSGKIRTRRGRRAEPVTPIEAGAAILGALPPARLAMGAGLGVRALLSGGGKAAATKAATRGAAVRATARSAGERATTRAVRGGGAAAERQIARRRAGAQAVREAAAEERRLAQGVKGATLPQRVAARGAARRAVRKTKLPRRTPEGFQRVPRGATGRGIPRGSGGTLASTAPTVIAGAGVTAPAAVSVFAEDPIGYAGRSVVGARDALFGIPSAIHGMITEPGETLEMLKDDYARRYGALVSGDKEELRKIYSEAGVTPYAFDALVAAPTLGEIAGRALRAGGAGIVTKPRPALQAAINAEVEQPVSHNLTRAIGQRIADSARGRATSKRAGKGDLFAQEALGRGNVVPIRGKRAQRRDAAAVKGRYRFAQLHEIGDEALRGIYREAQHELGRAERLGLKYAMQYGIHSPKAWRQWEPEIRRQIEEGRAESGVPVSRSRDELRVLDAISQNPDAVFTRTLADFTVRQNERMARLADSDPSLRRHDAELRRGAAQRGLMEIHPFEEEGVDVGISPYREQFDGDGVEQVRPSDLKPGDEIRVNGEFKAVRRVDGNKVEFLDGSKHELQAPAAPKQAGGNGGTLTEFDNAAIRRAEREHEQAVAAWHKNRTPANKADVLAAKKRLDDVRGRVAPALREGGNATIRRYGKEYNAEVVRVTKKRALVRWTYKNGERRETWVDRRELETPQAAQAPKQEGWVVFNKDGNEVGRVYEENPGTAAGIARKQYGAENVARLSRIKDDDPGPAIKQEMFGVPGTRGDVPDAPGTKPLPEGHVRLYHYTDIEGETVAREGLDISKAKGETYGEPNAVWASAKMPDPTTHRIVEFSVRADDPRLINGIGGPIRGHEAQWAATHEASGRNVALAGSVKPSEIIGVHEPWHHTYRYIKENNETEAVLRGEHDAVANDPAAGPALAKIKQEAAEAPPAALPAVVERRAPITSANVLPDNFASSRTLKKFTEIAERKAKRWGLNEYMEIRPGEGRWPGGYEPAVVLRFERGVDMTRVDGYLAELGALARQKAVVRAAFDDGGPDSAYVIDTTGLPKQKVVDAVNRAAIEGAQVDVEKNQLVLMGPARDADVGVEQLARDLDREAVRYGAHFRILEADEYGKIAREAEQAVLARSHAGGSGLPSGRGLGGIVAGRAREAEAAFLKRAEAARRAGGLEPAGYFPSQLRRESFSEFAVGGRKTVRPSKRYKDKLRRWGLEDPRVEALVTGAARNIKRKWNWNLVDDVFGRWSPEWGRDKGIVRLILELEQRGIDLRTVEFWNPERYARLRRVDAEADMQEALAQTDDVLGGEVGAAVERAGLSGEEVLKMWDNAGGDPERFKAALLELGFTDPGDFVRTQGWSIVPREIYREVHASADVGLGGRFFDVAIQQQSRWILGVFNIPWLQFQVMSNAVLTGLAGVGPMDLLGAQKWWRSLTKEEQRAVEPYVGLGHFQGDVKYHSLGASVKDLTEEGQKLVDSYRALRDTTGGKVLWASEKHFVQLRHLNPLDLLFRADNAQNNFFRRAILYNSLKREAYKNMGLRFGEIGQMQRKIVNLVDPKKRAERDALINQLVDDRPTLERHAREVSDMLGDYMTYTYRERKWLKRNVIFYGFMRFSLRLVFYTMPVKHPIVTGLLGNMARLRADEIRDLLGSDILPYGLGRIYTEGGKLAMDFSRANPVLNALTQTIGAQGVQGKLFGMTGIFPPMYGAIFSQFAHREPFSGQIWEVNGENQPRIFSGVGVEDRLRIMASQGLRMFYPYRVAEEVVYGGEPQGTDTLVWDPRPTRFKDPTIKAKIARQARRIQQDDIGMRLLREAFPWAPRPTNDPAIARAIAKQTKEEIQQLSGKSSSSASEDYAEQMFGSSSSTASDKYRSAMFGN